MTKKGLTNQVFLSYARRDQALATEIASELEKRDFRFWLDEQIEAGANHESIF